MPLKTNPWHPGKTHLTTLPCHSYLKDALCRKCLDQTATLHGLQQPTMRLTRNSQENDTGPENSSTSHHRSYENLPNRLSRNPHQPPTHATTPTTPTPQHHPMPHIKTPITPTTLVSQMHSQTQRQTPQDGTTPPIPWPQDKPRENRNRLPTPSPPHISDPIHYRHCQLKRRSQSRLPKLHKSYDGIHRRLKSQQPSRSRCNPVHQPQPCCHPTSTPGQSNRTHSIRSRSSWTRPCSPPTHPKERSHLPCNDLHRQPSGNML